MCMFCTRHLEWRQSNCIQVTSARLRIMLLECGEDFACRSIALAMREIGDGAEGGEGVAHWETFLEIIYTFKLLAIKTSVCDHNCFELSHLVRFASLARGWSRRPGSKYLCCGTCSDSGGGTGRTWPTSNCSPPRCWNVSEMNGKSDTLLMLTG